jgi:DNA polymerase-4
MYKRAILHLDMDAFFASVECLKNSSLNEKPLVIGGLGNRGVVASCNYIARKFGVYSGMPVRIALQRCPDVVVLKGDMDTYSRYSKMITEIIESEAPEFEKSSIDEFYLDLTGMDKHIGCWKWGNELRNKLVHEVGLPISFGLSINKLVSKVGTSEAKPDGKIQIPQGNEKLFLAPLSVRKMPGIGNVQNRKLSMMGVRTIQTLSEIPPKLLQREFGKTGISFWKKANGIDNSPVIPYREKKSISTERTFQMDTIDVTQLKNIISEMISKLGFELRNSQRLTSCITVKIRYTDFNTYTLQRKISYTANDRTLSNYAYQLFEKLYQRRQLVRLVGVKISHLVNGNYQINLFDDTLKEIRLMEQMDKVRKRFGTKAILKAATL